ncbi:unnamed protein product [Brassica oleracea var. botrytis]|uniref:Uncharacterized protein n=1 Tax=Brassica oleracea TaxID=3712 RepID=A0A3P6CYK3_BRAOL|nr:unnamed protein product [Brassica oleracea]
MGEMGQIAGRFDGVHGRELGGGKPEMEDFPNTEHSFPSLCDTTQKIIFLCVHVSQILWYMKYKSIEINFN